MLSVGLVPGLKSVAIPTIAPESISGRAGAKCWRPRWKQQPGSNVQTTFERARARMSVPLIFSRWSALAACSSMARRAAPVFASCSAWMRGTRPPARPAARILRDCATVNAPRSQKTSQNSARPARCYRGNPAIHQQVYVGFRTAAIFRGNNVRPEKRCMDIERMLLMQFREQRQNFEFALPVEAVAAFGFDGGSAVGGE